MRRFTPGLNNLIRTISLPSDVLSVGVEVGVIHRREELIHVGDSVHHLDTVQH